jgi:ribosomal protein S18 acetylase RimI-like enzyme
MKHLFLTRDEFLKAQSYVRQVCGIWQESFPVLFTGIQTNHVVEHAQLSKHVLVHLLCTPKGRRVVGTACYYLASKESLQEDDAYTKNLLEQGVKVGDAYLHNMAIRKKSRRKGFAHKMLVEAQEYLKNDDRLRIVLAVYGDNLPAIALYNKLGYQVYRAIPKAFLMEKNLA